MCHTHCLKIKYDQMFCSLLFLTMVVLVVIYSGQLKNLYVM